MVTEYGKDLLETADIVDTAVSKFFKKWKDKENVNMAANYFFHRIMTELLRSTGHID
jgi:hypothetical protein